MRKNAAHNARSIRRLVITHLQKFETLPSRSGSGQNGAAQVGRCVPGGGVAGRADSRSQTTHVPAGEGTVVDLFGQVPSTIVLVDHALARAFDKEPSVR